MKKTVIITAIGSFSAQAAISACHAAGMRVVGCDIYPAEWVVNSQDVDVFYKAPYATDRENYRNFLKELCKKEQADVLIPLTDVEIDVLQEWRTEFSEDFKELGAEVWISDVDAIRLCRNKEKMETFLRERKLCRTIPGVRLPELEALLERGGLSAEFWKTEHEGQLSGFAALRFPLVAKPFDGRSSQGLKILESESDLRFLLNSCSEERKQQYLVQPKIGGTVITVDVVRNPETKQTFCLPRRELLRTLNGAGTSVCVFRSELLEQQCRDIAEAVGIRGCVNMEFIEADRDAREYYFLECNPRFAGGVAFSGAAGYDMVKNHIRCFTGEKLEEIAVTGEQYIARRYAEYRMDRADRAAGEDQGTSACQMNGENQETNADWVHGESQETSAVQGKEDENR